MIQENVVGIVKQRQNRWAATRGISVDADGYCRNLVDNFFQLPSDATRRDFQAGDGAEFSREGGRGKIQALHSSSALACNFFDYWRDHTPEKLGSAIGAQIIPATLCFERKFPTGLRGNPPNLDVVLEAADGGVLAIESKFTEAYSSGAGKFMLKPAYFPDGQGLWAQRGLPGCQAVADSLRTGGHRFQLLDVAQLLKHMLGLATQQSPWHLCCLWYRMEGELGDKHQADLESFTISLGSDSSRFSSMTYQSLFQRLRPVLSPADQAWTRYMGERYFSA